MHRTADGDAAALQGISLQVEPGERLCVVGPSGAGKTSLLRIVAGLQPPSAGEVRVFGRNLGRLSARERARLRHDRIGILEQCAERSLSPDLTAGQAIALPLALRGTRRRAAAARAAELLGACGLAERSTAHPAELSGGERQRVALCVAVAHRPQLLLADEPTAEVDPAAATQLAGLIDVLARDAGAAVLIVTHDPALAAGAPRVIRLREGRIASERTTGPPALTLDRAGWIRIPERLRREAGFGTAVTARAADGGIVLAAVTPRDGRAVASPCSVPLIAPPVSPAPIELTAVRRERGRGAANRKVLSAVTARLAPGRLTAVTGPSGSGKTTLLELIAGLQDPDAGEITVAGIDLAGLGPESRAALRRARMGYLDQEPAPAGFLTATENVLLGLSLRGHDDPRATALTDGLLGALGLGACAGRRVARLSAGEAQRVALAVAVAGAGGVLIADEPTSRLDGGAGARVIALLRAVAAAGHTVVCATHDPAVIGEADALLALGPQRTDARAEGRMAASRPLLTPETT